MKCILIDCYGSFKIPFIVTLQTSNLLYVDQPTGTGFSYSSDRRDLRHNEEGVSNDLYDFMQVCFFFLLICYSLLNIYLMCCLCLLSNHRYHV
uniref:Uncharacterized protein n=1 Tax=Nelumbo nucifera TaxID=4432 RepID=A0A822YB89_NELNU|nr:TPA_asm: hypothetical protein HUJ06_030037 [Nelumbo nucifera]